MHITWRERIRVSPALRDIESWPSIDEQVLEPLQRKKYLRNLRIVCAVLVGKSQTSVAKEQNVSEPMVSYLLKRALGGEASEAPALNDALIPSNKLYAGRRQKALSTIQAPKGSRGSLTHIFDHVDGLKITLDKMIESSCKKESKTENLSVGAFHKAFLRLLREAHWPNHQYPFDQEKLGYESIRSYFHTKRDQCLTPKPRNPRVITTLSRNQVAYREIQIDAQIQDLHSRVDLSIDERQKPYRLSRVALLMAVDADTGCRLAFHLCLSKDPSQFDVLALLKKLHGRQTLPELQTPGLSYGENAAFPTMLGGIHESVGYGMIRLDNAMAHWAHSVQDYVCDVMGSTLGFGLPAQPKTRKEVELAFKTLNHDIHRVPSTTGSHHRDPKRESSKRQKKPPRISLSEFEEALAVVISGYNAKSQARLNGHSPIELIRHQGSACPMPQMPPDTVKHMSPFHHKQQATVRWNKNEGRKPHINFEGVRYSGNCLLDPRLANQKVVLKYDSRDIRHITVLTKSGKELGEVSASASWLTYPHSIYTRKKINKLTRRKRLSSRDLLGAYFEHLLEQRKKPKEALELVRVYRELKPSGQVETLKTVTPSPSRQRNSNTRVSVNWAPKIYRGARK